MSNNIAILIPCRICKELIPISSFQEHILSEHNISFMEYIGAIGAATIKETTWHSQQKKRKSEKKIN